MKDIFKTPRALRIYGISALILCALCITLRVLGIMFFFDSDIGYFQKGSPVSVLAELLPALCVIAALVVCFVPKICPPVGEVSNTRAVRIAAILPALGFIGYAVSYGIRLLDYTTMFPTVPLAYWLLLLSTVLSAVFFLLVCFKKNNGNALFAVLGVAVMVWLVLSLADSYFDVYIQMNSPLKNGFQFACLGAMLLVVNELRTDLDVKRPHFHLCAATVATVLLGTVSISSIIGTVMDKMPENYILYHADCVLLPLFIYSAVRLVCMCFSKSAPAEECADSDTQLTET